MTLISTHMNAIQKEETTGDQLVGDLTRRFPPVVRPK
jgi:hypothetical protein